MIGQNSAEFFFFPSQIRVVRYVGPTLNAGGVIIIVPVGTYHYEIAVTVGFDPGL